MRPGPSAFVRPDCTEDCKLATRMHGGPCGSCLFGTNPGRTHRFFSGQAVLPFGFGLSYSTWRYDVVAAPEKTVSLDPVRSMLARTRQDGRIFPSLDLLGTMEPLVQYSVNVTNTGSVDADDILLGFLKPPGAGKTGVPLQSLWGFERVHVKAGATVNVILYPSLTDFTHVDESGERDALPGVYTFMFGVHEAAAHGMGYLEHRISTT